MSASNMKKEQVVTKQLNSVEGHPSFFKPSFVQPKLEVSSPTDIFEQEADRISAGAMEIGNSPIKPSVDLAHRLQRVCSVCQDKMEEPDEDTVVQRKASDLAMDVPEDFADRMTQAKGKGESLPSDAKNWAEHSLGYDFSPVRVHTGEQANSLCREVGARAFTHEGDVFFKHGEYCPDSHAGRRLLAHELVHTVQQGAVSDAGTSHAGHVASSLIQRDGDNDGSPSVVEEASVALLDRVLPLGFGFYFEIEGGVTWGYPVYTGGAINISVTRQRADRIHIRVRKQGRLALDTGVGGSFMLGARARRGGGSRGYGVGAEAGANAMAGVQGTFIEEYSIPVADFLTFIGTQMLENTLATSGLPGLGNPIIRLLEAGSTQYLIQQRMEGGIFATADAEASAGVRRPTDGFNSGGDGGRHAGGATWGPNGDRDFQGRRPDILDGDPLSLLNFLGVFAGANVNMALTVGFDQRTSGENTITSLFIEGQYGVMLGLPIPVVSDILSSLPPHMGGGVELRIVRDADGNQQVFAVVYAKHGEDQVYAGTAGQQDMVINLTNLLSWDEIFEALRSGNLPTLSSAVNVSNLFEHVSFFQRLALHSPNRARFAALLRRQRGVRSLLATTTLSRAQRMYGGSLNVYLDFGASITGPDFMVIARRLLEASGGAAAALSTASDFASAYQALSSYFSGYAESEAFEELSEHILGATQINAAKLRLEIGVATGVSARVAEGAKARFDVSGEVGLSCELDIIQMIGGPITLGNIIPTIIDVLNDPVSFLPDCPLIRALYRGSGGGAAAGTAVSDGSGNSRGPEASSGTIIEGYSTPSSRSASTSEGDTETRRTASGGYEITTDYPDNVPELTFQIHQVENLERGAPVGYRCRIRMFIAVPPENTTDIWVPVEVVVRESSERGIVLEVAEDWWIERLRIGSHVGQRYNLGFH